MNQRQNLKPDEQTSRRLLVSIKTHDNEVDHHQRQSQMQWLNDFGHEAVKTLTP